MTDEPHGINSKLYSALELVFKLHGHDARKRSQIPVLAHLLSVCALVQHDSDDIDEAIGALLHDALEDKPEEITRDDIEGRFGKRVLDIVEISTDTPKDYSGGPKPPWLERKIAYLNEARKADPPSLLRVTVADKIDNARAILADHKHIGNKIWNRFNAGQKDIIWYYTESYKAYQEAGFKGALMDELEGLVKQLQELPIS